MRLHTTLEAPEVYAALRRAKDAGKVSFDVDFEVFLWHNSRKNVRAFEIQLGTYDKTTGPTKNRRYKNSGRYGAKNSGRYGADSTVYAASYDEWGWFIAQVFDADPDATFGPYKGIDGFDAMTKGAYRL